MHPTHHDIHNTIKSRQREDIVSTQNGGNENSKANRRLHSLRSKKIQYIRQVLSHRQ